MARAVAKALRPSRKKGSKWGEGQVFLPMHYGDTNRLTLAVFDPQSRQPSYKACAVRVEVAK